jgi:hypothetical protein
MSQARIEGPEVVHGARRAVLRFGDTVDAGLSGVVAAMNRVRDRLRVEMLPYWKSQVMRRQEVYQEARRRFLEAEDDLRRTRMQGGPGKGSSDDERRTMIKAKAKMEEAEEKIAQVKKWLIRLDDEGDALAAQCTNHAISLREMVAAAADRLDRAADALEHYQSIVVPPVGGSHG